jgi:hypothetical protein
VSLRSSTCRWRSSACVAEEEDAGCVKLGGGRDAGHGALCRPLEVHGAVATGRRRRSCSCGEGHAAVFVSVRP